MKISHVLFFYLIMPLLGIAQECLPNSPIVSDYPSSEATLENLFMQHKPRFSEAEYLSIRRQLEQCNATTDRELERLVSEMSSLSLKYQEVLSYKDVAGIEKQIRDLEQSREKSRQELEQNLSYVKHTGIFVVLLENIDPYENKSSLIGKATSAITFNAIEDLVGTNIRRVSEVNDFVTVRDVVQAFKGGEVKAEKEYFNQPNFQKNYFLYVAKIGATPLKQKPNGNYAATNAMVINLSKDTDFRYRLRNKGVIDEHIKRIEQDVVPYLTDIQRDNAAADDRQEGILQRGTEEVRNLEREIIDAKSRLGLRSNKIGKVCTELGVTFDDKNIGNSVDAALQNIKWQIQDRATQWTQTKEREIVFRETQIFVEGSPTKQLAMEAIENCKHIEQTYGLVDRVQQITEVENSEVSNYNVSRTLTFFRSLQRLWAYPIPQENGSFKLAVMAKMSIKKTNPVNVKKTAPDAEALKRRQEEDRRNAESAAEKARKEEEDHKKREGQFVSPFGNPSSSNQDQGKPRNQGVPGGTGDNPFGKNNGSGGGSGGGIGASVGGGLGGRAVISRGRINTDSQKSGRVVVEVCVDRDGNVINADYKSLGSTTSDLELHGLAIKAAKGYVFAKSDASKQCGTITFNFRLQ